MRKLLFVILLLCFNSFSQEIYKDRNTTIYYNSDSTITIVYINQRFKYLNEVESIRLNKEDVKELIHIYSEAIRTQTLVIKKGFAVSGVTRSKAIVYITKDDYFYFTSKHLEVIKKVLSL